MGMAFLMRYLSGAAGSDTSTESGETVTGTFDDTYNSPTITALIGKKRFVVYPNDGAPMEFIGAITSSSGTEKRPLLMFIYFDGTATTVYIDSRDYASASIQVTTDGYSFDETTGQLIAKGSAGDELRYIIASGVTYRYQSFD